MNWISTNRTITVCLSISEQAITMDSIRGTIPGLMAGTTLGIIAVGTVHGITVGMIPGIMAAGTVPGITVDIMADTTEVTTEAGMAEAIITTIITPEITITVEIQDHLTMAGLLPGKGIHLIQEPAQEVHRQEIVAI